MSSSMSVIVIGAGMSGIAAGYYLNKYGIPYRIIEANAELGGTWYKQRFHGVRFDSMHVQTLFSFEPMPCEPLCDGKTFLAYLHRVAEKYKVLEHIHFSEKVEEINWTGREWKVITSKDEYASSFVINANGYYTNKGYLPEIFKQSDFKGTLLHSFDVDQDKLELAGQDVVLVGSGATSVTMVPELYKQSKSLTLVQRSATYVIPTPPWQYPLYPTVCWLYSKGITLPWRIYRIVVILFIHGFLNALFHVFKGKWSNGFIRRILRLKLDEQTVKQHFTPSYDVGEQRLCASKGFIETIPKIKVHTGKVNGLQESGIVVNGDLIKADIIICATGFDLNYFKFKVSMEGNEVDMYERVIRHDFLFEGIPNFCNLICFNRLAVQKASCFTPLMENNLAHVCKMLKYMDSHGHTRATIKPTAESTSKTPPMTSGYFQRNASRCFPSPQSEACGSGTAWKICFGSSFNPESYCFA